jgi:histidyl-tRNA synthetase
MSGVRVARPRGTEDLLPAAAEALRRLDDAFRAVFRLYGFREIRTPLFEHTDLFLRGVGEDTDVVAKEMYSFADRAGRSLTLRPEGTAGVVRAYLDGGLQAAPQPVKLFYSAAPMFRYDRPAEGRYRQFHQAGVELLGTPEPAADAETVALAAALLTAAGMTGVGIHLNSIGCPVCRPVYRQRLLEYYRPHVAGMCADCQARYGRNPLRLLDCKVPADAALAAGAPRAVDTLCAACAEHFQRVQQLLSAAGVPWELDHGIVRGLDYYTRTVFEAVGGAEGTLCGGGRYDGLVETLGGPATPAVGFALGMERLLAALARAGLAPAQASAPEAFVVGEDPAAAFVLAQRLRAQGIAVEADLSARSARAQMRQADRLGARVAILLGGPSAAPDTLTLRDLRSGAQQVVPADRVAEWLR